MNLINPYGRDKRQVWQMDRLVSGDVQPCIAFINGAEQAPEVEPDGPGIVRIALLEGVLEGFGRQQAAE